MDALEWEKMGLLLSDKMREAQLSEKEFKKLFKKRAGKTRNAERLLKDLEAWKRIKPQKPKYIIQYFGNT